MMNRNLIPKPIQDGIDKAAQAYADSPATTNAGRWLRFLARLFPPSALIKMLAHKTSTK